LTSIIRGMSALRFKASGFSMPSTRPPLARTADVLWIAVVSIGTGYALWLAGEYLRASLGMSDVIGAFGLGFLTLARVVVLIAIAGASAFPTDLREASTIYRLRSWQWWRDVILPGIFPYYVTGALTASGGSWNASIVAEVASWGDTRLRAAGLGAFIAEATE